MIDCRCSTDADVYLEDVTRRDAVVVRSKLRNVFTLRVRDQAGTAPCVMAVLRAVSHGSYFRFRKFIIPESFSKSPVSTR